MSERQLLRSSRGDHVSAVYTVGHEPSTLTDSIGVFFNRDGHERVEMTFVTKLTFQSGDREALDETVDDLKQLLQRKGANCKGPHTSPSERITVPLHGDLAPDSEIDTWSYEVYVRELEIHGSDEIAREVGHSDFHDAVHVEIEVDQKTPMGR